MRTSKKGSPNSKKRVIARTYDEAICVFDIIRLLRYLAMTMMFDFLDSPLNLETSIFVAAELRGLHAFSYINFVIQPLVFEHLTHRVVEVTCDKKVSCTFQLLT